MREIVSTPPPAAVPTITRTDFIGKAEAGALWPKLQTGIAASPAASVRLDHDLHMSKLGIIGFDSRAGRQEERSDRRRPNSAPFQQKPEPGVEWLMDEK